MSALEVKNLYCGYDSRPILKDVTFVAEKGEFVALLGPNGCGKTTLLRAISKIIPLFSGEVLLRDKNINQLKRRDIAKIVSIVPQISEPIEGFSVEEIVFMGRDAHMGTFSSATQHDSEIVEKALEKTILNGFRDRDISTLSGGEYQRVIIARALAQGADVILLDEPTAHLDIKYQIEIMQLVKSFKDKLVIATFHDLNIIRNYCNRIIFLKDGELVADGQRENVLTPQMIKRVYEVDVEALNLKTPTA